MRALAKPGWYHGPHFVPDERAAFCFNQFITNRWLGTTEEKHMIEQIEQLQTQGLEDLRGVQTLEALYAWRNRYLGKTSVFSEISRGMGKLSAEERPIVGQRINAAKQALQAAFDSCEEEIKQYQRERELREERVDVTLPGRPVTPGSLHPTTQIIREVERIFAADGLPDLGQPRGRKRPVQLPDAQHSA